ncbi:hypothetical protein CPCC7001_409 [Cyanobium sp. PCC 7001]|uniref:hypothetical protein n=1 Tax=Cyanobium sp. PCC 7001 TaxID=180281 RepID=UPI00018049B8|nr:hypothetical protein [Cyanobium sp. PCC 7001]EDY37530.1 hypothetical protein CPCC7001_409 [Cyanobium sp. PCC 7001]
MTPLPDRVVIVALLATVGLCFALVFWTVKLHPRQELPMQWKDAPSVRLDGRPFPSPATTRALTVT